MGSVGASERGGRRWATVPNALCAARLAGSAGLLGLAWADRPTAFVWLFVALAVTDLVDGRLARYLGQQSDLGARIDTVADVTLHAAVLVGVWWMRPGVAEAVGWQLVLAVASYGVSVGWCLARFGRLPSYHTLGAKACWYGAGAAVVVLLTLGWVWPVRVVLGAVVAVNAEAVAITAVLPRWRSDVPTLRSAVRSRRASQGDGANKWP